MKIKTICFEGIDGCGKTTQINFLKKYLKKQKKTFKVLKFPTQKNLFIKKILNEKKKYSSKIQFLSFLIDIVLEIDKLKKEYDYLILDRYVYSTISYQCSLGFNFLNAKKIIKLLDLKEPNLILFLDILPEISIKRKRKQKTLDSMEKDLAYQKKVRTYFKKLSKNKKFKTIKINEKDKKENIFKIILKTIKDV